MTTRSGARARIVAAAIHSFAIALAMSTVWSCAALVGLGDHELFPDAGDAAADGSGVSASDGRSSTCSPNAVVGPVDTFQPLPDAGANVCRVDAVRDMNDRGVGLDALEYGSFTYLEGQDVTACIGVTFPGEVATLTVRARAVADACGRGCANGECGTGRRLIAFYGTSVDTLRHFDPVTLSDRFEDYTFSVPNEPGVTRFAVCRQAWSPDKDDVEVDAITARCR